METKRNLIHICQLFAVLFLFLPAAVQAQFYSTTNNGTITIAAYTGSGGAVKIPSSINGLPVTSIGTHAFYNRYKVISVTIPDSVTRIENSAFQSCADLSHVSIPDSVTSIGFAAFSGCHLASITIPRNATNIGDGVFDYCGSLAGITVDVLNPAYSSVDGVLFNKSQTRLIKCPESKTGDFTVPDSVTNIDGNAFYQSHLTSITIPRSVTEIDVRCFSGLPGLTNITILSNDTKVGSNPEHAAANDRPDLAGAPFYTLNSLSSSADGVLFDKRQTILIRCPEGKTGSYSIPNGVTIIGPRAFSYCGHLTSITTPDSVTNIGNNAFEWCPGLTSITIGSNVKNIEHAFESCINLTNAVIGKGLTTVGNAPFNDCFSLTTITVDTQNSVYSSVDGVLLNKRQTTLIKCPEGKAGNYTIPNGVTKIEDSAFQSCTHLTSITLPKSVTKIGEQAFYLCSATGFYFQGNAPRVGKDAFNRNNTVTVYHLPGTWGWRWRSTLGGASIALWKQ